MFARPGAVLVWQRNFLVWRKMMVPSLLINFGEPLLYLLGMGYGLGRFIGEMQGLPYITFLASGIVASSAMNTASFEGMYSVYTRMVPQRTHHAMLCSPLDVKDIILGEQLWCATKSLFSGAAILLVALLLGVVKGFEVLLVLPVVFFLGLTFSALAVAVTSLSNSYEFFSYYFTIFITPMFFLCGVFFPLDNLPFVLQALSQGLPLTHGIQLVRPLMTDLPSTNVFFHLGVLAIYTTMATIFSLHVIKKRLVQ